MQYIHDKLNYLKKDFEVGSDHFNQIVHIQNAMNGEFAKMRAQIDKLSLNIVDGIEVTEATSNNTRLTISPNCRTTLKIARNIKSEKVKSNLIEFAKYATSLYKGNCVVRGKVVWDQKKAALVCDLQSNDKNCLKVEMIY